MGKDYNCSSCNYHWTSRKKFGAPSVCPHFKGNYNRDQDESNTLGVITAILLLIFFILLFIGIKWLLIGLLIFDLLVIGPITFIFVIITFFSIST
jgi:hypothetical protein